MDALVVLTGIGILIQLGPLCVVNQNFRYTEAISLE
jgi:hypothetical protein